MAISQTVSDMADELEHQMMRELGERSLEGGAVSGPPTNLRRTPRAGLQCVAAGAHRLDDADGAVISELLDVVFAAPGRQTSAATGTRENVECILAQQRRGTRDLRGCS